MAIAEYDGMFFKLTFYSTDGSLFHTVYSRGIQPMQKFIQQHNFDPEIMEHIEVVSESTCIPVDSEILPHQFKSKYSDDTIYTVYTTEDFVCDAVNTVCAKLAESLMFGTPIINTKIDLFRVISDLIGELKYVYVLDHGLIDDETLEPYSSEYERYTKQMSYGDDDGYDDAYIYDSMYAASNSGSTQPITLEAYVTYFSNMLTDEQ